MNERIKELAEQAGGGPSKWYTDPDVLEEFANLVMQECANAILNDTDRYRKEYFAALVLQTFMD